MTKKSPGRIKRDKNAAAQAAYKKKNTGWSDVAKMYSSHQSTLNKMANQVKTFFEIPNIDKYVPAEQGPYTVTLLKGFSSDVTNFQKRLTSLYDQHKDRTGMVNMEEATDYAFLVSLFAAYADYGQDVQTILMPVYIQILGVMETIENNLLRINAEEKAAAEAGVGAVEPAGA